MKALLPLFLATLCLVQAESNYPVASQYDTADPIASPDAIPGGSIVEYTGPSPKSLNYYLDNNVMSASIFERLYETLIGMDPTTLEYDRALAKKWTISDDKKTFTFWLDENARWSDGRPVTAQDVIWTYDAILNPANMTGPHKLSLERLQRPEVADGGKAVRFTAKEVHWQNLSAAGGFSILPKHIFEHQNFNKINFEFPVVSGPYQIKEFKEGFSLTLERRKNWWRSQWKSLQNVNNFDTIVCRFYNDRDNAFDAFLKGEIDMFPVYTARQWFRIETCFKAVKNNWIVKQEIHNQAPIGFQGFAMNMRRPPFNDRRVRKAMAHLVDRPTMNHTLMYDQYFLHRSYSEDLYDESHPCPNSPVPFSIDAARKLLTEAGWKANPNTGILEKEGIPFAFTFLNRDGTSDKFLAIFGQALKTVGIQMTIQNKDWSAWAKDMDTFAFDMTWAAWGAGLYKNPENMWSSKEADREGGSNITGFKNAKVDELIEKQKTLFNVAERHEICRQIDALVFEEHPYALLWNINYTRLLYWNKFGTPDNVLGKYSNESHYYWWYDDELANELQEAMKTNQSLPRPQPVIHFQSPSSNP